jgi:hypothetical protein
MWIVSQLLNIGTGVFTLSVNKPAALRAIALLSLIIWDLGSQSF